MSILNYIEKMKEMYEGERITAQGPRNMAHGGMIGKPGGLVEEGVEYYSQKIYKVTAGSHKGDWALAEPTYNPATKTKSTKNRYFKSKPELNNYLKETKTPKKYSNTELNKAAQHFFKKNYDELTVESGEKTKAYDRIRSGEGKFSKVTQADPLTTIQQNKILKEYPNAKFTPTNKFGFKPDHPLYQTVVSYVNRGYKKPFQSTQLQALPKYAQEELIEAFREVDFNFDRDTLLRKGSKFSKYGVQVTHPKYKKISKYFAKSKVWKYNFDLRSPEGWMMSQMERNYAQNGDASPYRPITKNGGPIAKGNPMIGIEHNGKKYNMKTIVDHADFDNTKKYWNIADKTSKKYLSEFDNLAKLLPEGFDPKKIQVNDLLQFISDKDGIKGLNRAKRAIQIHHEYGVGPRATTNYQLLRQDMNLLANKTNNLLKSKDLSKVEKGAAQALKDETRLVVKETRYGPTAVSARGDIKSIISQAETEMKGFKKKDWTKFSQLIKSTLGNKVTSKEAGFIATDMLKDFGKMGLKGGKLLKWLQLEYDVLFESLIYQYHKQYKGQEPELAREALWLPKIIAKYAPDLWEKAGFEPFKAGVWEGPEKILEERLMGENESVKNYIDNNKRMEEISSKYRSLDFAKGLKSDRRPGQSYYAEPFAHPRLDTIVNEQRRLENEYNQLDQLNKPDSLSGYHTAYQTAKEKQDTKYGVKTTEAHKKRLGVVDIPWDIENPNEMLNYNRHKENKLKLAQKRFEDEQADKRRRAVEDKYPTLTKSQVDKALEDVGLYIDPDLRSYKGRTVQRPEGLKYLGKPVLKPDSRSGLSYDDVRDYWKDLDKQSYYADNFRMEKAGGGIVGIRKPSAIAPTGGPQSQGLASTSEYGTYNKEYKWQT